MIRMRQLTSIELEDILSAISSFRINKNVKRHTDEIVFDSLRMPLRAELESLSVPDDPKFVKMMKKKLRERFILALATPGINEGSRAASSNMEPITQIFLRAGHSAGAKNVESPVLNIARMKIDLVTEHIFTVPKSNLPGPEFYIGNSPAGILDVITGAGRGPRSLDGLIELGFDSITSPLESMAIKDSDGIFAKNVIIERTSPNAAAYISGIPWDVSAEDDFMFCEVRFSIHESMKLRYSPWKTLATINEQLGSVGGRCRDTPFHCALVNIDPEIYTIALITQNPTLTYDVAMSIRTIGSVTENLRSFEIVQIATTQCITLVEEVDPEHLGFLAPCRADGRIARSWRIYMSTPNTLVPAKHICSLLAHLGFRIVSCDRNAAGRCDFLHVAEHFTEVAIGPNAAKSLTQLFVSWIEDECSVMSNWEYFLGHESPPAFLARQKEISPAESAALVQLLRQAGGSGNSIAGRCDNDAYRFFRTISKKFVPDETGRETILDWKISSTKPFSRYLTYRYIKFAGHYKNLHTIFKSPSFDWECTFSDNVPATAKFLCTPTARQVMDYQWFVFMSSDKVSQTAADYVTLYGAGMGPRVQPVTQAAINQGGPLAALNENPMKVFVTAAVASDTYQTVGSQSDMVTGTMSNNNGTSSVRIRVLKNVASAQSGIVSSHNGLNDPLLRICEKRSTSIADIPIHMR